MATYKNYPILESANTIASVPAYTVSLVDTLAAMLGNADYQTWSTTGSLSGWEWDLTFKKLGRIVFIEPRTFKRATGSSTVFLLLFTVPAAFRPGFEIVGPSASIFTGTTQFQVRVNVDGNFSARNTGTSTQNMTWALPNSYLTAG